MGSLLRTCQQQDRLRHVDSIMDSMKESENGAGTTSTRVFTRHTLLQLSQSPLVHVPPGMAAMDEWYGYVDSRY